MHTKCAIWIENVTYRIIHIMNLWFILTTLPLPGVTTVRLFAYVETILPFWPNNMEQRVSLGSTVPPHSPINALPLLSYSLSFSYLPCVASSLSARRCKKWKRRIIETTKYRNRCTHHSNMKSPTARIIATILNAFTEIKNAINNNEKKWWHHTAHTLSDSTAIVRVQHCAGAYAIHAVLQSWNDEAHIIAYTRSFLWLE